MISKGDAMLSLKNITKDYGAKDTAVRALDSVSIDFRDREFVSILGASGCGKTTLLNIIGGLDRYTSGDLSIDGISTKEYRDRDWDTYRNHKIGFVFQSYNLIPHQTVLANVELALTLSGISGAERKTRATEALEKVGLGDQLHKKPNQMSGGQMQRVAIARALVNDPEILLADEPTGALDSETGVQIMELLRSVSKDKLIIMVTHNPSLAEEYSSRIIRLADGKVIDDSDPFDGSVPEDDKPQADGAPKARTAPEEDSAESRGNHKENHAQTAENAETRTAKSKKGKRGKTSMSVFTALSLSLNNLMTKKARTFLTSFAGSIGIIGIALILALSNGIQLYINKTEEDVLSSYPVSIEKSTMNIGNLISSLSKSADAGENRESGRIYSKDIIGNMIEAATDGLSTNNLKDFKSYIEKHKSELDGSVNAINYGYSTTMNVYKADTADGVYKVNPSGVMAALGAPADTGSDSNTGNMMTMSSMSSSDVWTPLMNNDRVLQKQYDVVTGRLPKSSNEIVLIVDENECVSDYTLYSLGLKDSAELSEMMKDYAAGKKTPETKQTSYSYSELLSLKYKLLVNSDLFEKNADGTWSDRSEDDIFVSKQLNSENAIELSIVGIIKPTKNGSAAESYGLIGYREELMTELIDRVNDSEIVKYQKENEGADIFTGLPFKTGNETVSLEDVENYISSLPENSAAEARGYIEQMRAAGADDQKIAEAFAGRINSGGSDSTLEDNLTALGVSDLDDPSLINIYPKDFESKTVVTDFINKYNDGVNEADKINYNDYIGLMLSSVTAIINAISYILIAFVSISLIVSSIMIGIITYISVLERTKEIGILRSIGASKKDIARVFNAETLIVGFIAGIIGIGAALLLCIPINAAIASLTEISAKAQLPAVGAVVLVAISMLLTFISGLIPAKKASKKDPVEALRSE